MSKEAKDKAEELIERFRFKFLAIAYCNFYIWLIRSTYLEAVKQEILNRQ